MRGADKVDVCLLIGKDFRPTFFLRHAATEILRYIVAAGAAEFDLLAVDKDLVGRGAVLGGIADLTEAEFLFVDLLSHTIDRQRGTQRIQVRMLRVPLLRRRDRNSDLLCVGKRLVVLLCEVDFALRHNRISVQDFRSEKRVLVFHRQLRRQLQRRVDELLVKVRIDIGPCDGRLRHRHQADITEDAANIMMGILVGVRRVVYRLAARIPDALCCRVNTGNAKRQHCAAAGLHQLRQIDVPGRKASDMRFDIAAVDPDAHVAVHAVKAKQDALARKILRDRDGRLIIVFIVCLDIKALHGGLAGNLDVLPAQAAPLVKIEILIRSAGRRHAGRRIIRYRKQELPAAAAHRVIQLDLCLRNAGDFLCCARNVRR